MSISHLQAKIKAKVNQIKDPEQLKMILRLAEKGVELEKSLSSPYSQKTRKPRAESVLFFRDNINLEALPFEEVDGKSSIRSMVDNLLRAVEELEQREL